MRRMWNRRCCEVWRRAACRLGTAEGSRSDSARWHAVFVLYAELILIKSVFLDTDEAFWFPVLKKKGIHWKLFVKQNRKREKTNNKKVIRYYFWVSRDSKQAYTAAYSNKSLLIVVICLNELRLVSLALHTNVQTLYPACFYSSQKQQALSEALPFLQPAGNERPLWIAAECKTETTSAGSWTGTSAAWPPGALVAETAVRPPGNSCYAISHPPHSDTQILSMASGCIKPH